ncbi:hypothetical protein PENTCL1PPCAC_6684, partial [Pristionchus entomophagus]
IVPKLNEGTERDFLLCLNRIPVKTDIVLTSQCLVKARDSIGHPSLSEGVKSTSEIPSFVIDKNGEEEERKRKETILERLKKRRERERVRDALRR